MNAIEKLFSEKKKEVLSIYFTAGFPRLQDTNTIIMALQKYGANMIEIGMPYSDPLADGPVIQKSSMQALHNGMNIRILFEQLKKGKDHFDKKVPLILMGYLNPVLQYGFEKFCKDAASVGISGIILPDLPAEEYEKEYKNIVASNGLDFIFLITPETSEERIRKIDSFAKGFIYAVSSSSVTGKDTDMAAQEDYFRRIRDMKLAHKIMIGFGIKNRETYLKACEYASGAIIGTAYIKAIENAHNPEHETKIFLNSILQAYEE